MEEVINKIEQIILSCFDQPVYSSLQIKKGCIIVYLGFDKASESYSLKISLETSTLEDYSKATEVSKIKFESRLRKAITARKSKYDGGEDVWPINLFVPL